ncbi:MAG: hypothetical protein ACXWQR_08855 [Ktedonobacterales bacterium]
MTPERVEAYIEAVTTNIAARVRHASRRLGTRAGQRCERRIVLPPSSLRRSYFLYPKAEPHPDEWLRTLGYDRTMRKPASAPVDFTARVMARVSVQEQRETTAERIAEWAEDTARTARRVALERVGVVAAIVAFAALVALISGCVITILAPRAVLTFLGTLLTFAVAGLAGARAMLALVLSMTSNDGLLLALAALPIGAMLIGSRLIRHSPDSLRQA